MLRTVLGTVRSGQYRLPLGGTDMNQSTKAVFHSPSRFPFRRSEDGKADIAGVIIDVMFARLSSLEQKVEDLEAQSVLDLFAENKE